MLKFNQNNLKHQIRYPHRKNKCSNAPVPSICGTETGAERAKLFIFRSVYVLILTYGHECWIMTEKVRSRLQAAEMGFLQRISGLILLDKAKSADIRASLNIESLLLRLEKLQLRWYGHVTRMSQERTAKKLLCSTPIGRRPRSCPRTRWGEYVDLSWSRLGIPAEHLSFVAEDEDAWRLQLALLLPRPPPPSPPWISESRK